jgi:hypothetical protein
MHPCCVAGSVSLVGFRVVLRRVLRVQWPSIERCEDPTSEVFGAFYLPSVAFPLVLLMLLEI